jgi:hypothetical protein
MSTPLLLELHRPITAIMLTFLLALILVYFFTIVGFVFLSNDFVLDEDGDGDRTKVRFVWLGPDSLVTLCVATAWPVRNVACNVACSDSLLRTMRHFVLLLRLSKTN